MLLENSHCDVCGTSLGKVNVHAKVYCIPCIEEMERLGMGPNKYRKHKAQAASKASV